MPSVLLALALLAGCRDTDATQSARTLADADPALGRTAIDGYGCGTCHVIPGIRSARGVAGPPLTRYARRGFVAGALANTPDNLILWIRYPQSVEPGTVMPNLGVSETDARNIAAYLYTLE